MIESNNSTGDKQEAIFQAKVRDSIVHIKKKKGSKQKKMNNLLKVANEITTKAIQPKLIEETINSLNIEDTSPIKDGKSNVDIPELYFKKENMKLFTTYGSNIYSYSKWLEEESQIKSNILTGHKINPAIRTKMIDWILEVFYAYQCDQPAFFLAVDIMDHYFYKETKVLFDENIHLIGIVSMFIASKMEDLIPLRMIHVKGKIGHNKFSEDQIKIKEKEILKLLDFNIISVSTYDFVQTIICDLTINNSDTIDLLKMDCHIDSFDNVSRFLAKLITLENDFCVYSYSLKGICCIIVAFDIIRSNSKTFTKEMEDFMRQWVRLRYLLIVFRLCLLLEKAKYHLK